MENATAESSRNCLNMTKTSVEREVWCHNGGRKRRGRERSLISPLPTAVLHSPIPDRRLIPHVQRSEPRSWQSFASLEGEIAFPLAGELHGRKGQGWHGHRGNRRWVRARSGTGVEDLALGQDRPQAGLRAGRYRRPRRDPADLDDPHRHLALQHSACLLGRRGDAQHRGPHRRLLRHGLGPVRARSTPCRCASTPAAPSTATGRCPSASTAA